MGWAKKFIREAARVNGVKGNRLKDLKKHGFYVELEETPKFVEMVKPAEDEKEAGNE